MPFVKLPGRRSSFKIWCELEPRDTRSEIRLSAAACLL